MLHPKATPAQVAQWTEVLVPRLPLLDMTSLASSRL